MKKILHKAAKSYLTLRSWKTNRKIIVIESDDWGSIRMPDTRALKSLSKHNIKINNDYYSQLDTVARKDDLEHLFELLYSFNDFKGNNPIITANTIVANPDFEKIKESNFESYEYETFDKTINKLKEGRSILELWKKGQQENIFKPQLHGREHLNAALWLKELQLGNKDLLLAFDQKCFSIPYSKIYNHKRKNLMASLDYVQLPNEIKYQENYIKEASSIFYEYFGFKSQSFIAPAYIWHPDLEARLKIESVDFLQGLPIQLVPNNKSKFSRKMHFLGQKNSENQCYLVRNVFFEPSYNKEDCVNNVLNRIHSVFKNKQPVIIGSHRVNFIGSLVEKNRTENLKLLEEIFKKVLKKWPDVEFMSSDDLGNLILQGDKK